MNQELYFCLSLISGYIVSTSLLNLCKVIEKRESLSINDNYFPLEDLKVYNNINELYDIVSRDKEFVDIDEDLSMDNDLPAGKWCNFLLLQTLEKTY